MANRSYLYNIDFNTFERPKTDEDIILSVSEYAYEIPLVYKILVSIIPASTKSILWDYEHPIAISGDAANGRWRLFRFLDRLKGMDLYDMSFLTEEIEKTKQFFTDSKFKSNYFQLECGELYEMSDKPLEKQNQNLLKEMVEIDKTIDAFVKKVKAINFEIDALQFQYEAMTKKTWFRKSRPVLSNSKRIEIQKTIENKKLLKRSLLGIDNWSSVLYFQFDQN